MAFQFLVLYIKLLKWKGPLPPHTHATLTQLKYRCAAAGEATISLLRHLECAAAGVATILLPI